jgi:PAS domain S-box-containing protein
MDGEHGPTPPAPSEQDMLHARIAALEAAAADDARLIASLRADEASYRLLAEHSTDMISRHTPEGVYLYVSLACQPLLGYDPSELVGRSAYDFYHPDDLAAVRVTTTNVLVSPDVATLSYRFRRRDGTYTWFETTSRTVRDEETGALVEIHCASRDVTERKRAETTLRETEQRYRTVVDSVEEVIFQLDDEGRWTLLNRAWTVMTGFTVEESLGTSYLDHVHPDDRQENLDWYQQLFKHDILRSEVRYLTKDGGYRWVAVLAHLALAEDGTEMGISGTLTDITQRKAADDQIRREAARAEALVRVAARLNTQLELDAVLLAVCEETARSLHVPIVSISLYDRRSEAFYHACDVGLPPEHRARAHQIPRALYNQHARRTGPLVGVLDVQAITGLSNADLYRALDIRTLVGARLLREGKTIGVLHLATTGAVRHFSSHELDLLTGLTDQAVQAITNARLFREAGRRLEHLHALHAIDMTTSASLDVRVTLNVVLDQVIPQLGVDAAAILLLNPHTQVLEYVRGRGFRSSGLLTSRLRLGEDQAGLAALERRLITVPDLSEHHETSSRAQLLAGERFIAYFAVPLIAKGQVKGVLEIFHRSPLNPDSEWRNFLDALATQTAIALDNAALFNDLQRSNTELTLAYDATIEGWSRALELRDQETEGHTLRVTEMAVRLARGLGMSEGDLVHLRRGALLHDIGKMGIPDGILLKAGALMDEEWSIMRRHPVYAHSLLSPIVFLRPALDIPYCHHEKWDGTGYPRGLRAEEIPLAARIFAVVDVWDALRSDRPYREGWPDEKVLAHIQSQAGTHFDPRVVEAFLAMMNAPLATLEEPAVRRVSGPSQITPLARLG